VPALKKCWACVWCMHGNNSELEQRLCPTAHAQCLFCKSDSSTATKAQRYTIKYGLVGLDINGTLPSIYSYCSRAER
jgi:hypothetical protein